MVEFPLVDFELDVHARQDGHRNGRHARNKREEDRDKSARICISFMAKHRFSFPSFRARLLLFPEALLAGVGIARGFDGAYLGEGAVCRNDRGAG
ncbi:MAG TPA: hypothetical protein VE989_10455 [Sphingomicrobium sp.]|nr:hypothetical protein [Sphingomicrobium sp.]